jgi:radical SAM protein with 4Fe4S-binding SPASM domain
MNPRPGLYHFERNNQGEHTRVHLRIDPDRSGRPAHGTLLINANRVLHLNSSASAMAYLALSDTPMPNAIHDLTRLFHVSPAQAESDYTQFIERLDQLILPDGACPVCDLDIEITAPFSVRPSAPYRMDLALTYRCNNNCAHCYNSRPRDFPELETAKWKNILDRLWEIGIPHIVFTGGEPTLRTDLPELIAHAEKNGQITGLNTNARRLIDENFVSQLIDAGLDHVQITVESHDPLIHNTMVHAKGAWSQTIAGLRNVLDTPLYVMTNTTMRQNSPFLGKTLDFLASLGVPTIGLNALIYSGHGLTAGTGLTEKELRPLLDLARDKTERNGQRLIWYTPTQYCHFDPMQLELGVKGCTAALYNMCVEPDGGVIPCQSYYQQIATCSLILEVDLNRWLFLLRTPIYPQKCNDCVLLPECGGGCPLALNAIENGLIPLDTLPSDVNQRLQLSIVTEYFLRDTDKLSTTDYPLTTEVPL